MKRKFISIILLVLLSLTMSCRNQPIAGIESSVAEMGDIERVKVLADQASVKSGCSNDTNTLQTCNKDTTLDVESPVADWYAVKLQNSQIGFVPKGQCTPVIADDKKPAVNQNQVPAPQGTSTPQGTTSPKTPSTQANSAKLTDQEQQMVKLVNDARSQNGLKALSVDMQLTNVARIKAQDMIDNKYFSHYSPKYGSPFDMMKAFGVKYVQAGENIAGNQNVQNAFNALMNSPGHRKNILSPDYTHIGIGIKKGGSYGNMFSQMFVSKPQ